MKFNQQLRRERELKGWSQQDLAEQLGTTPLSVSRWECAVTVPKPYFRRKLCVLFERSAEELGLLAGHVQDDSDLQGKPDGNHSHTVTGSSAPLRDPAIPLSFEKEDALVGRNLEFQFLKHRLLAGAGSLAIFGLPGVGKTALVASLAHDHEICSYFPDGILWVSLGREPQPLQLLRRWGTILGLSLEEMEKLTSIDMLAAALRDRIGMRRMLLVIDDIWELKTALNFKVGGMNCMHLATTRFPPIALHFANRESFPIHELSEADSIRLLRQLAPSVVADELSRAQALIHAAGGLPLTLTLMGKYLQLQAYNQQPRRIQKALEQLDDTDTRLHLSSLHSPAEHNLCLATGSSFSLQSSIGLSEQQLDPATREGLRVLSIFPPKPNSFSEVAALEGCGLSEAILDTLTDAGLLESCGPGRYTFHRSIVDYAKRYRSSTAVDEGIVQFFVAFIENHQQDYDLLALEYNNIQAAFDLALRRNMLTALQRGVALLSPFLKARGLCDQTEKYLCELLGSGSARE